jgi:hypothetical protein
MKFDLYVSLLGLLKSIENSLREDPLIKTEMLVKSIVIPSKASKV